MQLSQPHASNYIKQSFKANNMTTYLIKCKGPVCKWMPTKLYSCPPSQRNHLNWQVHRLVKYKIHLYCHMAPPCVLKVDGNIQLLGDLQGLFCSYLHHSSTYMYKRHKKFYCYTVHLDTTNKPFARPGHTVQNYIYWWASCTVELPNQKQVHCFGSPTVQLARQNM